MNGTKDIQRKRDNPMTQKRIPHNPSRIQVSEMTKGLNEQV
ncbi:MAG: hypothetical protein ACFWTN_04325 [Clostridium sp.]